MRKSTSINPLALLSELNWEESEELEFKSARGGVPSSLWETYSALANTHGGVILLGVEDNGTITGIDNIQKIKKVFWDTVNNHSKVNINLLTEHDVIEVKCNECTYLAIRIPQASRYQRPVYLNQNPLKGTYRRNHEGDYHCTEQEVSRMLADKAEEPADRYLLENFSIDDLDKTSIEQYRNRFASHKPNHPWLNENNQALLTKLGAYRYDRKSQAEGITKAGLLMFGKDETIREVLPSYHVDFRETLAQNPDIRWTDRLTADGSWHPNLFQFYIRVIQRLGNELKLPFKLNNDLFRQGESEVHIAIREALVNALIHADYQGEGGIVIIKRQNLFEFSNPGNLLISMEQLLRGNVSECRNKTLQHMFMLIGAAEKAGSGIDKIRHGWASQHWRSPLVREQVQPDRVRWLLPMVSLIPDESMLRLQYLFGNELSTFSPPEIQALVTADLEEQVDNARLRQITGMHAADTSKILQNLVTKGALERAGQGRWTVYFLPKNARTDMSDSVFTQNSQDNSAHNNPSSVHNNPSSVHNNPSSVHTDINITNLTVGESAILVKLASAARSTQRIAPDKMEQLILTLCQNRWLTRRQLGEVLQRNADGLRTRFLTSMVQHGLLQLRYPDKPNRSDQAYTATETETAE